MQQKAGTDYSEDVETSPTSVRWVWRHRANQLSHSPEYEWKEMATSVGEGTSVSKLHDLLYSSQESLTLPSPKLTFPLLLHKRTAQALIWKSQLTSGYYPFRTSQYIPAGEVLGLPRDNGECLHKPATATRAGRVGSTRSWGCGVKATGINWRNETLGMGIL